MSGAPTPQGYDVSKAVPIDHPECLVTVGFDRDGAHIPRFMIALQYLQSPVPLTWEMIARFDHNETSADGHDLYDEGIHIDVETPTGEVTLYPTHQPLPRNRGQVIRACVEYFDDHTQYFVNVFSGDVTPSNPPGWPDGGDKVTPTLMPGNELFPHMASEPNPDSNPDPHEKDVVSKEELSELLADATGSTPDEIERGAEEIDIAPPEDADVISSE